MLLTLKEVCKLVNVSTETIRNWRKNGVFPRPIQVVINGKLLWDRDIINKWIKDNK